MHTALGVDGQLVGVREYNAARADGREGFAVFHDARAHSRRRVVARAADNQGLLAQSGQRRGFRGDVAGHFAAFIDLRQHALVDVQNLQQLVTPAAVRNIQHLHAAGIGNFRCEVARQHEADVVLRQQHVFALFVVFRLMVPHPHQLAQGESRQCGVGGDPDQVIISDLGCDLFAFLGSPLVAPDNGRTDDFVLLVQHDQSMHLAADAQGNDIVLADAALLQHGMNRADRGVVPVLGILFRPAVLRLIHRVFHRRGADAFSVLVKQNCLCAGSAQINTKQIFHMHFPLCPQNIVVFAVVYYRIVFITCQPVKSSFHGLTEASNLQLFLFVRIPPPCHPDRSGGISPVLSS